jgi:hypothetical protein
VGVVIEVVVVCVLDVVGVQEAVDFGLVCTPVTLGTALGPDPISTIFSEVALITACARWAFLLSRSYTTYALLRKVSPKIETPMVDDWIPNGHCVGEGLCGRTDWLMGREKFWGRINWLIGTLIVIPVNVYSTVKRLDARLQSTYAAPLLITAFTTVKIDSAIAAGNSVKVVPLSNTTGSGDEPPFRVIRFPAASLICTPCSVT